MDLDLRDLTIYCNNKLTMELFIKYNSVDQFLKDSTPYDKKMDRLKKSAPEFFYLINNDNRTK